MDDKHIEYLEALAGLSLEPAERATLLQDLRAMVHFADRLAGDDEVAVADPDPICTGAWRTVTQSDAEARPPAPPVVVDVDLIRANHPGWHDPFHEIPAPSRDNDEGDL